MFFTPSLRHLAKLALAGLVLTACSPAPVAFNPTSFSPISFNRQQATNTEAFFAYPVGKTLTYAVTLSPVNDPLVSEKAEYTLRVEEVNPQAQGQEIVFRASTSFGGKYQYPRVIESAQGVRLFDATLFGMGADEVKGLSIDFLHKDLKVGQRWEDENWIAKVKAQEDIVVPAGRFKAWKIEVIGTFEQAYTAVGDYWLVPGVGMVKSVLTQPGWHITSELK
jgi:hypothetical protein